MVWCIGRYSPRFQQPAFQRVDFVNEGHWRRSACIDFPLTSRVARRWTLSSWFISALSVGALASIAYSR